MGKKIYVDCTLEWAKLREQDRDMGPKDGSDTANTIEAVQGNYLVNCVINNDIKAKMIKDGIPAKGLQSQLFKTDNEGKLFYKAKRPHFNPKLNNQETGEKGVVFGPPKVFKEVDGELVEWAWEADGLIGNGSKATVKFDVWDGKITTLEAIKVTEHVKFEKTSGGF